MREIDPRLAIILRDAGKSWDEIGRILADARKRRSPFQGTSVWHAVKAYNLREKRKHGDERRFQISN